LRVLRDGIWALVVLVAVGVGVGLAATQLQPVRYQTDGTVVVSPSRGFLDTQGADALPAITDTITRLVKSPAVLQPTAQFWAASAPTAQERQKRLKTASLTWLDNHVSAQQVAASSIIKISAVSSRRHDAQDLATAAINALTQVVDQRPGSQRGKGIVVRGFLTADQGKVSPTPTRNLLLGANAGLLLGLVGALMLGSARRRLRRPEDTAAELGVPLLGRVQLPRKGRVGEDSGLTAARARLALLKPRGGSAVYLLTGAVGPDRIAQVGEGLARLYAGSSSRVLLVDADLSSRSATQLLDLSDRPGLGELLNGHAPQADQDPGFLQQLLATSEADDGPGRLTVLPAGSKLGDPASALGGQGLAKALDGFRHDYDVVVVVGPGVDRPGEVIPLLAAADRAILLAPDGLPAQRLRPARELADALADRVAGTLVVNRA
jgi:capsular polysaccharide biosynthesis protein